MLKISRVQDFHGAGNSTDITKVGPTELRSQYKQTQKRRGEREGRRMDMQICRDPICLMVQESQKLLS